MGIKGVIRIPSKRSSSIRGDNTKVKKKKVISSMPKAVRKMPSKLDKIKVASKAAHSLFSLRDKPWKKRGASKKLLK